MMPNFRWAERQSRKKPRYFCTHCLRPFRTGKFSRFDWEGFDAVCPYCGAIGDDFRELMADYKDLALEKEKEEDEKIHAA